jgi:hypothetical protein
VLSVSKRKGMIAAIAVATFAALVLPLAGTASAQVVDLTVDPLNAINVVGQAHTLTVTALELGLPVDVVIAADIAGANATATITSCSTGADGICRLTYTGTNPGTDTITICVDLNTNGTCELAEVSVTATKTYVPAADVTVTASPVAPTVEVGQTQTITL